MERITEFERQAIASGLRSGKSMREIARSLGRDHRVIAREIARNTTTHSGYKADIALRAAARRAKKTNKHILQKDVMLHAYVVEKLKEGWSPEQIAGRLQTSAPTQLRGRTISHESIYRYIYDGNGKYERLVQHLRRKQKRRKKKNNRKPKKNHIPERVSIHARPAYIHERQEIGHWESDSVIARNGSLSVQYERKTKLLRIHKVPDLRAQSTEHALVQSIESLPSSCVRSITFDNGGEGACHTRIKKEYKIETYFCDAYASWQKGGVENSNGLIREYVPKRADLAEYTPQRIYEIQERLNNRPRKTLNYKTPNEALQQELGGALNS